MQYLRTRLDERERGQPFWLLGQVAQESCYGRGGLAAPCLRGQRVRFVSLTGIWILGWGLGTVFGVSLKQLAQSLNLSLERLNFFKQLEVAFLPMDL